MALTVKKRKERYTLKPARATATFGVKQPTLRVTQNKPQTFRVQPQATVSFGAKNPRGLNTQPRSSVRQVSDNFLGGVGSAVSSALSGAQTLLGTGIEALPGTDNIFDKTGQALQRSGKATRQYFDPVIQGQIKPYARPGENKFVSNLASGAGSLVTAVAAGPTRAALMFGVGAGGDTAQKSLDKGDSPNKAFFSGATRGVVEGGLETIPLRGLDDIIRTGGRSARQVAKQVGVQAFREGGEEFAQSLGGAAIEDLFDVDNPDYKKAIVSALEEAGYGAILGAGSGSIASFTNAMSDPKTKAALRKNISKINQNQGGYLSIPGSESQQRAEIKKRIQAEADYYEANKKEIRSADVSRNMRTAKGNANSVSNTNEKMFREFAKDPDKFIDKYGLINQDTIRITDNNLETQVKEMLQVANNANPQFQQDMDAISKEIGATFKAGPVKKAERIIEKVNTKYDGDITRINDVVRSTMTLDNPTNAQSIVDRIHKAYPVVDVDNGFISDRKGYKDVQVKVQLPGGVLGEIILTPPEMLYAKDKLRGHKMYKESRTTVDANRLAELESQMNKLYSDAEAATAARLAGTSIPSTNALAGANGLPVATTVPETAPLDKSSRIIESSTLKNRGYVGADAGIKISPNTSSISQEQVAPVESKTDKISIQSAETDQKLQIPQVQPTAESTDATTGQTGNIRIAESESPGTIGLLDDNSKKLLSGGSIRLSPAQAKQRFKAIGRKGGVELKIENPAKGKSRTFSVSPKGIAREGGNQIKIRHYGKEKSILADPNKPLLTIYPDAIAPMQDISNYAKGMKDFYRNTERVFESIGEGQQAREQLLEPFDQAKGDFIDMQNQLLQDLKTEIVDRRGIKAKSQESAWVQQYGEAETDSAKAAIVDEIIAETDEATAANIIEADQYFRGKYDELLTNVNKARALAYPGRKDKQIPRRDNYYRHFQELEVGVGALMNLFETPANIDPALAGVSDFTKPKSKFLGIAQKRLGNKTEIDAVGGFLNYIRQASYATHVDPQIKRIRDVQSQLVELFPEDDVRSGSINNYIEFLNDFANDLAGKTNPVDRVAQKYIPGGRKTFKVMDWMNKRVKANLILGNMSSSIAQFFNMPQGMADAGLKNSAKGIAQATNSLLGHETVASKSIFLKERYFDGYAEFDTGLLSKAKNFAAWIIKVGDEVGTKVVWQAEYQKATQDMGMTEGQAIKYADDRARKMVAGRGVGEVPLVQKSRGIQMVAPFQLEVQNLWHVTGEHLGNKEFGKLAKFSVLMFLMNGLAREIRGSDVAFDPIRALIDGVSAYEEEEDKKAGIIRGGGRIAGEFLSNAFFGQSLAGLYPEYGIKVGGETITREELFGDADPTRFGSGPLFARGLTDPFAIIPPFGGQQAKRTLQGTQTLNKGYSETRTGRVRFVADDNLRNRVQGTVFGQYSIPEARDYFDNDRTSLGDEQSLYIKELPKDARKDAYLRIIDEREVKSEAKEQGLDSQQTKAELAERIGGEYEDYLDAFNLEDVKRTPQSIAKSMIKGTAYEGLPENMVDEYIVRHGLKREDVEYAVAADRSTEEKLTEVRGKNKDELLAYLQAGRVKSLDGKYRANDKLLRELYDEGILTNNEYYGLKAIEDGTYKYGSSKTSSGGSSRSGSSKSKTISIKSQLNTLEKYRKQADKILISAGKTSAPGIKKTSPTSISNAGKIAIRDIKPQEIKSTFKFA